MSFYAKYRCTDSGCLLGGVKESQTSRYQTREDAEKRLLNIIEVNSNRCTGEVLHSNLPPEIFYHCPGHPATIVGGKCFGCGKVLTKDDAKGL